MPGFTNCRVIAVLIGSVILAGSGVMAQTGDPMPTGTFGTAAACNVLAGQPAGAGPKALIQGDVISTDDTLCYVSWNTEVAPMQSYRVMSTCHLPNDAVPEATLYVEMFDLTLTAGGPKWC